MKFLQHASLISAIFAIIPPIALAISLGLHIFGVFDRGTFDVLRGTDRWILGGLFYGAPLISIIMGIIGLVIKAPQDHNFAFKKRWSIMGIVFGTFYILVAIIMYLSFTP